ncbi:DUF805 domain-containing protein [Clostridium sp.]|uniref:DUF805 domain-containing protein n=1 Tax=Clostridium sp. TaxID=1506 RepID=UPI002FC96676
MTDDLFLLEGRINRKKYFLYNAIFLMTFFILNYSLNLIGGIVAEAGYELIGIIMISAKLTLQVVITLLVMIVTYKRLHDINFNGAFAILSALPYIQIGVVLILLTITGTVGTNKYGAISLRKQGMNKNK